MIVYKELSSLTTDLGISAKALYYASNTIPKHYHEVRIPKANGEFRTLNVPDDFLKGIQRRITTRLLAYEEISPHATAYRYGSSTIVNARPHVGREIVLKLDIHHFFDSIIFPLVKEKVFPKEKYSEANRVLLTSLCIFEDSVPQGAPTSPMISNIIMRDFDDTISAWCRERGICYTRYCDDMTFSGDFDPMEVKSLVKRELAKEGFFLNSKKTVILREGQCKNVTGIIVNDRLAVPKAYKKAIRQELYYCRMFGVGSHLGKIQLDESEDSYLRKMLGRVNYVISVEKENSEMLEYQGWIKEQLT